MMKQKNMSESCAPLTTRVKDLRQLREKTIVEDDIGSFTGCVEGKKTTATMCNSIDVIGKYGASRTLR